MHIAQIGNSLCGHGFASYRCRAMQRLIVNLLSPRLLRPLFWMLLSFALVMALLPKPPETPIDPLGDKFAHMLAFAALSGVARFAWPRSAAAAQFLLLALFGAAIELLQMIPALHRTSDIRDWAADCIAVVAAALVAAVLRANVWPFNCIPD